MQLPVTSSRGPLLSLLLPAICLAFLCSCGADRNVEAGPSTYTVRDSAGVSIVESSAPAWGDGEAWTLTEEPSSASAR